MIDWVLWTFHVFKLPLTNLNVWWCMWSISFNPCVILVWYVWITWLTTSTFHHHLHRFRLLYFVFKALYLAIFFYDIWTLSISFNICLVWLNMMIIFTCFWLFMVTCVKINYFDGIWLSGIYLKLVLFKLCFMYALESFMFVIQIMFCVCFKLFMFYTLWPFWCCQRGREKWVF